MAKSFWEKLQEGFGKVFTPAVDNQGRGNLAYNVLQPFAQAQNFIESGQRFEAPYLQSRLDLTKPTTWNAENIGTTAANMGIGFLNNTAGQALNLGTDFGKIATKGFLRTGVEGITTYDQMKSPIFRLAAQGIGLADRNQAAAMQTDMRPQAFLGNAGEIASSVADIYAPRVGSTLLNGSGKLIPRIVSGSKQGATTGAVAMGGEGLYQNRNKDLGTQLAAAGTDAAIGGAFGGLLGGATPVAGDVAGGVVKGLNAAGDMSTKILRTLKDLTPEVERTLKPTVKQSVALADLNIPTKGYFQSSVDNAIQKIRSGQDVEPVVVSRSGGKTRIESGADTALAYKQLGMDNVPVVSVDGSKLNTSKGRNALGQFTARLIHDQSGSTNTTFLTGGLDKVVDKAANKPAKITTGRDLANRRLKLQQQTADYIEEHFGRATTPAEQNRLYNEWERALKRETVTPNQNLNRQNVGIRSQNADRRRLANELFKDDPMRQKGVKVKIKPNVSDSNAGFPAKALLTGKDKATFSYQRETLLRNIEETFGRGTEETKEIKSYLLDPIITNETNRIKMVDRIRTEMSDLMKQSGIKRSSKEDYAAADFIEGTINADQLRDKFGSKAEGIIEFAEEGRKIYKDLLTRTNEQLTKYGYDPIPERQNYVTHTTQLTSFWEEMGNFLNFDKDKLPTAMSGIHTQTKPGKQFNPFALQRQGGSTHEGLATAMDRYLDVTTKQMFHTADVQRAREIQKYLTQQASSAGGDSTHLSNFNKYISQYTDSLAGKKSELDRGAEALIGRGVYTAVNKLRQRFGANAIGGSISSAVTNSIPMTQAAATTNKIAFTKGMLSNMKFGDEALIDGVESAFLRRRFPVSRIGSNAKTVARDAVSGPFQLVDKFTSKSVVAGKFYEGLQKGLDPQTAMRQADEYAARLMSDRSFGQSPLLFNSQTAGFFTQFQNEVNNQVSFLTKDIPKNLGMNKAQAASALTQVAIFGYLYNEMYEKMNGRRPAVDPIDIAMKSLQGDWEGAGEAALNTVPFASSVAGAFGMETGRIPMAGGIPNIANVLNDPVKELAKPLAYFAPPYGGGQIKKTIEGVGTYMQGGDTDKAGRQKFTVEATPGNAVRSALFGKWSTPEAQEYIQGIGKKKPVSTTQVAGVTSSDPTERLDALKEEKKRIEKLPNPGFLREGITEDERASQLAEIDKQIKITELSSKFDFKGDKSSILGGARASDKQTSAIKAVYTAYLDGDITQEQAAQLFQENGIDPKQAEYAYASTLTNAEKAAYSFEALNAGVAWQELVAHDILTDGVAKDMAEQGLISWEQYQGLKGAITTASGKSVKPKAPKKITLSKPKAGSARVQWVSTTPTSIKVTPPKLAKIKA